MYTACKPSKPSSDSRAINTDIRPSELSRDDAMKIMVQVSGELYRFNENGDASPKDIARATALAHAMCNNMPLKIMFAIQCAGFQKVLSPGFWCLHGNRRLWMLLASRAMYLNSICSGGPATFQHGTIAFPPPAVLPLDVPPMVSVPPPLNVPPVVSMPPPLNVPPVVSMHPLFNAPPVAFEHGGAREPTLASDPDTKAADQVEERKPEERKPEARKPKERKSEARKPKERKPKERKPEARKPEQAECPAAPTSLPEPAGVATPTELPAKPNEDTKTVVSEKENAPPRERSNPTPSNPWKKRVLRLNNPLNVVTHPVNPARRASIRTDFGTPSGRQPKKLQKKRQTKPRQRRKPKKPNEPKTPKTIIRKHAPAAAPQHAAQNASRPPRAKKSTVSASTSHAPGHVPPSIAAPGIQKWKRALKNSKVVESGLESAGWVWIPRIGEMVEIKNVPSSPRKDASLKLKSSRAEQASSASPKTTGVDTPVTVIVVKTESQTASRPPVRWIVYRKCDLKRDAVITNATFLDVYANEMSRLSPADMIRAAVIGTEIRIFEESKTAVPVLHRPPQEPIQNFSRTLRNCYARRVDPLDDKRDAHVETESKMSSHHDSFVQTTVSMLAPLSPLIMPIRVTQRLNKIIQYFKRVFPTQSSYHEAFLLIMNELFLRDPNTRSVTDDLYTWIIEMGASDDTPRIGIITPLIVTARRILIALVDQVSSKSVGRIEASWYHLYVRSVLALFSFCHPMGYAVDYWMHCPGAFVPKTWADIGKLVLKHGILDDVSRSFQAFANSVWVAKKTIGFTTHEEHKSFFQKVTVDPSLIASRNEDICGGVTRYLAVCISALIAAHTDPVHLKCGSASHLVGPIYKMVHEIALGLRSMKWKSGSSVMMNPTWMGAIIAGRATHWAFAQIQKHRAEQSRTSHMKVKGFVRGSKNILCRITKAIALALAPHLMSGEMRRKQYCVSSQSERADDLIVQVGDFVRELYKDYIFTDNHRDTHQIPEHQICIAVKLMLYMTHPLLLGTERVVHGRIVASHFMMCLRAGFKRVLARQKARENGRTVSTASSGGHSLQFDLMFRGKEESRAAQTAVSIMISYAALVENERTDKPENGKRHASTMNRSDPSRAAPENCDALSRAFLESSKKTKILMGTPRSVGPIESYILAMVASRCNPAVWAAGRPIQWTKTPVTPKELCTRVYACASTIIDLTNLILSNITSEKTKQVSSYMMIFIFSHLFENTVASFWSARGASFHSNASTRPWLPEPLVKPLMEAIAKNQRKGFTFRGGAMLYLISRWMHWVKQCFEALCVVLPDHSDGPSDGSNDIKFVRRLKDHLCPKLFEVASTEAVRGMMIHRTDEQKISDHMALMQTMGELVRFTIGKQDGAPAPPAL